MSADDRHEVWRGRLALGLDPRAQKLNDSLPIDRRLWPEELALTRAYALALVECEVMTADEAAAALTAAADKLEEDLEHGRVTLEGEDVHSAVEAELTKRCGDPARRIHTGRSRNDQVSTLMRMHVMQQCDVAIEAIRDLERAIARQARLVGQSAAAAYTHLQPAQPVLMAHAWLAHAAAFERDEARFEEAREAAGVMPLGSGAVAGTPLDYDRASVAMRLGFSRLATNSLDAVGDRDFALEFLNAGAVLGVHLSRLAEDLVMWCSPMFGWYAAPDGFSTGSSLLPQKRNPDVFELSRGKSARLITNAQRLAVLLKGLPSSYQKDLQEDKEAVFDTADTVNTLLAALAPAIAALAPDTARMALTLTPDLLAVELADALTAEGVPFREAHAKVGQLWAAAEARALEPIDLPEPERLAIDAHFTTTRLSALTVEKALDRRNHSPGAGPASVARQLARVEARLGLAAGDPEASDKENASRTDRTASPRVGVSASPTTDTLAESGTPADSRAAGSSGGRAAPLPRQRQPGMAADRVGGAERDRKSRAAGGAERSPLDPAASETVPGAPIDPATVGHAPGAPLHPAASEQAPARQRVDGILLRRARLSDVPGIAGVMADYVIAGTLLPRPTSELYQCIREFHVAELDGRIIACAALRLLWDDLGEVRSLAVHPDHHGRGLGAELVQNVVDDARTLELGRVIALTREVTFFERCGFAVVSRETLPRKVWTDCVRCPRRHACDEVAVVLDLVPGASENAAQERRSWVLPIPQLAEAAPHSLPIIS